MKKHIKSHNIFLKQKTINMKRIKLSIVIAAICSLMMGLSVQAQKPTLESLLPQSVMNNKKQLATNYSNLIAKIVEINPSFKKDALTAKSFSSSFVDLKKLKNTNGQLFNSQELLINDAIVEMSRLSDDSIRMGKIIKKLVTGVDNAKTWDDIFTLTTQILQSNDFANLSPSDKSMLHYTFLSLKVGHEYAVTNNLSASNKQPIVLITLGGNINGKSMVSINEKDEGLLSKVCYMLWWVGTAGYGTTHAYTSCDAR